MCSALKVSLKGAAYDETVFIIYSQKAQLLGSRREHRGKVIHMAAGGVPRSCFRPNVCLASYSFDNT